MPKNTPFIASTRHIQQRVAEMLQNRPNAPLDIYAYLRSLQRQAISDYNRYNGLIHVLRKQSASPIRNQELRSLRLLRTAQHHISHLISHILCPQSSLPVLIGLYRNKTHRTPSTTTTHQGLATLVGTLFEISQIPGHCTQAAALYLIEKLPHVAPMIAELDPPPSVDTVTAKQLADLLKHVLRTAPNLTPFEKQILKDRLQYHST